jgi:hypothetical protein
MNKGMIVLSICSFLCGAAIFHAQDKQLFATSVEYPDRGTLGCAGAASSSVVR